MGRINTNVPALTARIGLEKSQKQLNNTLQRLSTGLRINRGADDPAGLIASEGLRSETAGIRQGIDNSTRASNVIATAEGALGEVASLLLNIKALVVQAANSGAFSEDEVRANQLQIDSAVDSITRISNTTTFAGLKLLNGNLDYLTSGVNSTVLRTLEIEQVNFGLNKSVPVQVNVLTSARPAQLRFAASAITQSVTLEVAGNNGVSVLTFVSGTKTSAIAYAINQASDSTSVTARMVNPGNAASGIAFESGEYGSNSYVSVKAKSGAFNVVDRNNATVQRTAGGDATATINGAVTVGDGSKLTLNATGLNMKLTLAKSFGVGATSFAITGGGALFQLGPQVTTNQQVNVSIGSIAASSLGNSNVGFLTDIVTGGNASLVSKNSRKASEVLETAIRQVAILRGRLGAFERNTLQTNIASLQVALENVTSSESQLRDANFAEETSNLTRSQILTQAGTSVLATANSTPQGVLSLLQGR
jgi:flagellin